MKRAVAFLLLSCVLGVTAGLAPTTKPATRPTSHPASRPATTRASSRPTSAPTSRPLAKGAKTPEQKAAEDALRVAVLALTKEGQEGFRKEGGSPARTMSDYFKGQSPGIDQQTLLAALGKQFSQDPRVDSYIKFQLLSAIDKFDAANANDAIIAYVKAPALVPLPIVSPREQQALERKAMNIKEADVSRVNDDLKQQQGTAELIDAPMITYRDALRDKITAGDDAMKMKLLQARVEEMSQRAAAGIDTYKPWQTLCGEILKWSALAKKADLVSMNAFLKEYARRSGPKLHSELRWSTSERNPHAYWHDTEATLDEKRMKSLIDALEKAQATAV